MNRLLEGASYMAITDEIRRLDLLTDEALAGLQEAAPEEAGDMAIMLSCLRESWRHRLRLALHLVADGVPLADVPALVTDPE